MRHESGAAATAYVAHSAGLALHGPCFEMLARCSVELDSTAWLIYEFGLET